MTTPRASGALVWIQREIQLRPRKRGCHLVTDEILSAVPEIARIRTGLGHFFLQHTSASLTVNENADPDVRVDMENTLSRLIPDSDTAYVHSTEGADDMPAHLKSSLLGAGVTVPVSRGRVMFGQWQGLYLCEHRDHGGSRRLVITLFGEPEESEGGEK